MFLKVIEANQIIQVFGFKSVDFVTIGAGKPHDMPNQKIAYL
jgi:hypothetical protein